MQKKLEQRLGMSFESSHTERQGTQRQSCGLCKIKGLCSAKDLMKGKQRTRHTLANSCKHTADTGSVSKGNTNKATKTRERTEGKPGQGRYMESIPNDAQHRGPETQVLAALPESHVTLTRPVRPGCSEIWVGRKGGKSFAFPMLTANS